VCGRYTLTETDPATVASRFDVVPDSLFRDGLGRFNIAPGQEVLVIFEANPGERSPAAARWGLVPSWAPDLKTGYRMINARAEGLESSRAYGPVMRRATGRCLVPADGFYEWLPPESPGGPKRPVRFSLRDGGMFAFAGLTTERDWEGGRLRSCTIVTTAANEVVAPVHDRMPVLLSGREAEEAWLSTDTPAENLASLLGPAGPDLLIGRPADPALNRVGAVPEGPGLLEPSVGR